MKYSIFVFFAIFALGQAQRDWSNITPLDINPLQLGNVYQGNSKIVGGDEAVPHAFPFQAALFLELSTRTAFCGGSIISDEFILTAAHCVYQASQVEVVLGAHQIHENESTQKRYISKDFIVHKGWSPFFLTADIALIRLPEKIQFTDEIQPIRLPRYSDIGKPLTKAEAKISGWGKDTDKATAISPVLRYVDTSVISTTVCKTFYFFIPGSNHVCTSGRGGKSACSGDSGGPMVTVEEDGQITLQGAVSFGIAFGCEIGFPSVFTKVSSFLLWINRETGIAIRD